MTVGEWLEVQRGDAPLIVSFPHTGTELPDAIEQSVVSPWLARKDADYYVHELYAFVAQLGATTVRTRISRTAIDVNRDPSGASLYPGQTTTELCPTTTFDGEPLYREGSAPDAREIEARRQTFFAPYHHALATEIARLRQQHQRVVVYDAHSIRSHVPRLFQGELPQLNLGTNDGKSCDAELQSSLARICASSGFSWVVNGRFKGGWTTRHYGQPERGVSAVQLELAARSYLREPEGAFDEARWPPAYDPGFAGDLTIVLTRLMEQCLDYARARRDR